VITAVGRCREQEQNAISVSG